MDSYASWGPGARKSERSQVITAKRETAGKAPIKYDLASLSAVSAQDDPVDEHKHPPKRTAKATQDTPRTQKKAAPTRERKKSSSAVAGTSTTSRKSDVGKTDERSAAPGTLDYAIQEKHDVERRDDHAQTLSRPDVNTEQAVAELEPQDSDLSELGTTPEQYLTPVKQQFGKTPDTAPHLKIVTEQLSENVLSLNLNTVSPDSSNSPIPPPGEVGATSEPTLGHSPDLDLIAAAQAPEEFNPMQSSNNAYQEAIPIEGAANSATKIPGSVLDPGSSPKKKLKLNVSKTGPSESPLTPISLRQSGRSRVQPARFGDLVETPVEVAEEQLATSKQHATTSGGDSPTVQKAARNRKASDTGTVAKPVRRKQPSAADKKPVAAASPSKPVRRKGELSAVTLSAEDLAEDLPEPSKRPRKRKAETNSETPRKRPAKTKKPTDGTTEVKPVVRKTLVARKTTAAHKTPVQRKKKEKTPNAQKNAFQLPSPPMSSSDYLEASGVHIDPELLNFSRRLTHRDPLDNKPAPCGMPEVWAPGRQELCETLPWYKSANSGCYAGHGSVYAFMFDSAGGAREYMDHDVIIARMGGGMETDPKTGTLAQAKDHDIDSVQPQSLLNNMVHKNPLPIICGSRNAGAPTSMPHRYCVLDWYKPTHVWAEMTMGKKGPTPTIRYRFERLNTSKPSWFAPVSGPPDVPSDLILPIKTCDECLKECPQIYLIGWVCTNPKCVALWKLANGRNAPYGELDYHPAFLTHRTKWEREEEPFSLNPGVPQIGQHVGDNLTMINTRGIVCPKCGRCNPRYMFTHWRCDTAGCDWSLRPEHHLVSAASLTHTPWDMANDGPSLIRSRTAPIVRTQVRYRSNYKVVRYTFEGIKGSVIVAKANKRIVSEPGGADDMFRELQLTDLGLERRMMRATLDVEPKPAAQQADPIAEPADTLDETGDAAEIGEQEEADEDSEDDHDHKSQVGNRMTAFGMNYGMPYKFIASGGSRSFETAPEAIRAARSRLNFAQRELVNEPEGYQDFNEELVFAYYQGQMIKYHDDGEKGLGPRIATLSLGAPADMSMRVKAKYHSQVSSTGVFTYEKPLPLPVLESSMRGLKSKPKTKTNTPPKCYKETHARRVAAWEELQQLKASGDSAAFRERSKEVAKELKLKKKAALPLLSFYLTHGDIVMMEGEDIQKYLEHQVEPSGNLRYALTCRTILKNHLTPDQLPKYKVMEGEVYDGSYIREEGDREPLVWD